MRSPTFSPTRWKNRATAPSNFPAADLFPAVEHARILMFLAVSAWHVSHVGFFHIRTTVFSTVSVRGSFVLLTLLLLVSDTEYRMARYSAYLGRRVEVQYRAGDILLPASGIFVADSGRSIFLEQNFEQRGQHKHFRWEIPYQYLVRIEEKPDSGASANGDSASATPKAVPEAPVAAELGREPLSAAAAAAAGGAPFPNAPRPPDPLTEFPGESIGREIEAADVCASPVAISRR